MLVKTPHSGSGDQGGILNAVENYFSVFKDGVLLTNMLLIGSHKFASLRVNAILQNTPRPVCLGGCVWQEVEEECVFAGENCDRTRSKQKPLFSRRNGESFNKRCRANQVSVGKRMKLGSYRKF